MVQKTSGYQMTSPNHYSRSRKKEDIRTSRTVNPCSFVESKDPKPMKKYTGAPKPHSTIKLSGQKTGNGIRTTTKKFRSNFKLAYSNAELCTMSPSAKMSYKNVETHKNSNNFIGNSPYNMRLDRASINNT